MNKPLAWLILIGAGGLAYCNSFHGPFVFDDFDSIPQNASIAHPWSFGPVLHPPQNAGVGGRPLLNLSFALNRWLSGLAVPSYHGCNLLIHLLGAIVLFEILRRTFEKFSKGPELALAIAALWEVHPLQTASVTYLSQRAESLMALCYLLCLYGLMRGAEAKRPWPWLLVSAAATYAGALTKEVIVTAPVLAFLYDRTFLAGSFRAAWRLRWGYYLSLAGSWLVIAALMHGLDQRGVGYLHGITPLHYLLTESVVILRYLGLAFWPHPLVFDYGTWFVTDPAVYYPCCLIVGILLGVSLAALRRWPASGFLAFAFFLLLAPSSSVVPVTAAPMGENRMYLPLAAVLILLGLGLDTLLKRRAWIALAGLAALAILFTFQRNADYRTDARLWQSAIAAQPDNPRAHYEYANIMMRSGDLAGAILHYTRAHQLSPDTPPVKIALAQAEYDRGNLCRQKGQGDAAIAAYQTAVKLRPDFTDAWCNLGALELALNRLDAAAADLGTAVRLDPNDAGMRYDLQLAKRQLFLSNARQ